MDFSLTPAQDDLRRRAATLIDEHCIPLEIESETNGGHVTPANQARIKRAAAELGLVGASHRREHGGVEHSMMEQVVCQEEYGRNTNAVFWCMGGGYNVLGLGTPEQVDRYLRPCLRGERHDAYAVTERNAGSDPSGIEGTATPVEGGYRIVAEKWFVTSGDIADVYIVMVNVVDGDRRLPTLFLVDRSTPGITFLDTPPFTHSYPHGHPTIGFDCVVPAAAVLGGPTQVGEGEAMQNLWFVEERIHIAAR